MDISSKVAGFLSISYEGNGEGKTIKLLCVLWPMRQFGVFCWRGMLELLSSVYIKKLFLDRKVFLASLWCHASGTFRGVSLAD